MTDIISQESLAIHDWWRSPKFDYYFIDPEKDYFLLRSQTSLNPNNRDLVGAIRTLFLTEFLAGKTRLGPLDEETKTVYIRDKSELRETYTIRHFVLNGTADFRGTSDRRWYNFFGGEDYCCTPKWVNFPSSDSEFTATKQELLQRAGIVIKNVADRKMIPRDEELDAIAQQYQELQETLHPKRIEDKNRYLAFISGNSKFLPVVIRGKTAFRKYGIFNGSNYKLAEHYRLDNDVYNCSVITYIP